jgi:TonB-dependent starch-binding outer membrane protein SusC
LNRGMEFQVAYTQLFGNMSATFNGNFTTVHNKVLELANHSALRNLGLEEGLPIGFIYGYQADGIFQSQKEIDEWNTKNYDALSREQKPGDMYFKDLYGEKLPGSTRHNPTKDGVIDENDRTYIGKTIPGYYYGFTASANHRLFDVSVFFQGIGNVQKYNDEREMGENMSGFGRNQFSSVLSAWTENNRTRIPRAVYNDPNRNTRISSRFVENAGYVRLQNLQFGFTVPDKLLGRTDAIKKLRLYISGINLFTLTRYSGLDPEDDSFPNTRQILFGLNAGF